VPHSAKKLASQLNALGLGQGDGVFVHASMGAMGAVDGGAATVVEALLEAIGARGLLGMPGFTEDAVLRGPPPRSETERREREALVPGYDPQ